MISWEKKNSMVGFDILNITGSVSKSKQKDPFSEVAERSVMSPTLANSILGIRPGERVGNSKCRRRWKATFPPPSRLFSSQGAPQLSAARLLLHPRHALVHLVLSPLCLLEKTISSFT